jgi:hypothetical protein
MLCLYFVFVYHLRLLSPPPLHSTHYEIRYTTEQRESRDDKSEVKVTLRTEVHRQADIDRTIWVLSIVLPRIIGSDIRRIDHPLVRIVVHHTVSIIEYRLLPELRELTTSIERVLRRTLCDMV